MTRVQHLLVLSSSALLLFYSAARLQAQAWIAPSPAELSMTSFPDAPGAPAIYLNREEITDDLQNTTTYYTRIKVLTEKGKDYANVELGYSQTEGEILGRERFFDSAVNSIEGRTIHPDGTIIPFSGKPYDKLIVHEGENQRRAKVFTLPQVEVGSIIEYRYHLDRDRFVSQPRWFVQSNIYTVNAHFQWRPTPNRVNFSGPKGGQSTGGIGWFPVLPRGTEVKTSTVPAVGQNGTQYLFELSVKDVPPFPREEFMLPLSALSYRVIFYYATAYSGSEYWKTEGNDWSKTHNNFIGPRSGVTAAVQKLITPADSDDQKLHKIYDAVMALENTAFTRPHTREENEAEGHRDIKTTDDVLALGRGSPGQLTDLFIAMARAAGLKASLMALTSRDRNIFAVGYLSMGQLDDSVAIVTVNGKEQFFDPGQRLCEYAHLAWKHTLASGIRQTDGKDTVFASTPSEPYESSKTTRIGDLVLSKDGSVTGTVTLTMTGNPALEWRQIALRTDETTLHNSLKNYLHRLTGDLDVKVASVEQIADFTKPLVIRYEIKGALATATGKRLIVPAEIFRINATPSFTQPKRTTDVYYHYAQITQDAIRFKFDPSVTIESAPQKAAYTFKTRGAYNTSIDTTPTSFTVRRNLLLNAIIVKNEEFPDLKTFYTQFEARDQEPVVLNLPAAATDTSSALTK